MNIDNRTIENLNKLEKIELIELYINSKNVLNTKIRNQKKEIKRLNQIFRNTRNELTRLLWREDDKKIKRIYYVIMSIFYKHVKGINN